jgi:hypothetical protein
VRAGTCLKPERIIKRRLVIRRSTQTRTPPTPERACDAFGEFTTPTHVSHGCGGRGSSPHGLRSRLMGASLALRAYTPAQPSSTEEADDPASCSALAAVSYHVCHPIHRRISALLASTGASIRISAEVNEWDTNIASLRCSRPTACQRGEVERSNLSRGWR